MHPIKLPLLCSLLMLAACSSSENDQQAANPNGNGPLTGAITISSEPGPALTPLPDVEYDPSLSDSNGGPGGVDTVAESDTEATEKPLAPSVGVGTGGSTAGSSDGDTTGGAGTTGGTGGADELTGSGGDLDSDSSGASTGTSPSSIPPDEETVGANEFFRAGSLTAADYDDQLNPFLYQRYASDYLQNFGGKLDMPYLDLANRIELRVTDEQGRRYGAARIDITDANGQLLSLVTPASGITYLYTDIDALPAQFTLRATGVYGTAVDKTINLADVGTGGINIVIPEDIDEADSVQAPKPLDIMFVIDTTGSMGDELDYLQTELNSIIEGLPDYAGGINLGLTFYRDNGDVYVVRSHDFNSDLNGVQQTLNMETYGGGGDYPEAMDQALHKAIDASWQQDSKRILFLIADAPPHGNKMRATWNAAERARAMNIHIVPVAASGVAEDAEYLMRSMAAFTNSRYLFLTDDSGYGNSHAEPDVDCYVVTQLNNLMIRVMNSLISGVRQEPSDKEIVRTVGNYNAGVCAEVQTQ